MLSCETIRSAKNATGHGREIPIQKKKPELFRKHTEPQEMEAILPWFFLGFPQKSEAFSTGLLAVMAAKHPGLKELPTLLPIAAQLLQALLTPRVVQNFAENHWEKGGFSFQFGAMGTHKR